MTKTFLSTIVIVAVAIGTVSVAPANESEDFHKAFNDLLHKAIEDAVRGWEDGDGKKELEGMANMLEKLLKSQGDASQISDEDLEKWFGKDWMKKLGKEGGAEFDLEVEAGELNELARFLAKMAGIAEPGENEREHKSVMEEYKPVVADARKSTARVLRDGRQIALATVVDENGFLLTKLSEVRNHRDLDCDFSDGFRIGATRVDEFPEHDLALLKVDVQGLKPIAWANGKPLETGTFLAAAGTGEIPVAIGVASVASRDLSEADKGFLGVLLRPVDEEGSGVVVERVVRPSPAAEAGLKAGDELLSLNGDKKGTVAEFVEAVGKHEPGKEIALKVQRDGNEIDVKAKLGNSRGLNATRLERLDFFNQMGGPLSKNRHGYPSAFQTDLTLKPNECGGPLVDLDGKSVGINIARSGRVKSYAIPAAEIRRLLGDDRFSDFDRRTLEKELKEATERLETLKESIDSVRKRKAKLEQELKKANKGKAE